MARANAYNTVDPDDKKREDYTPHERVNESNQTEDKPVTKGLNFGNDSAIIEEEDSKLSERDKSKFSRSKDSQNSLKPKLTKTNYQTSLTLGSIVYDENEK